MSAREKRRLNCRVKPNFKFFYINLVILLCTLSFPIFGQNTRRQKKNVLPRVGAIKDLENFYHRKAGCGNHFLYVRKYAIHENNIFNSDDEGYNAWMNLDGRNVELKLVKTTLLHREIFNDADAIYEYLSGNVRITVRLRRFSDYIAWEPATITLRKGRAVRTIRAYITPQCD